MLHEYSLYFTSNTPSIMKGYNMKMVEGLHCENCYDNVYEFCYLDTMEKIQKALKLIRKYFGNVTIDITKDVQKIGYIEPLLVKIIQGDEVEVVENYYHGECQNCKSKIYNECEGADYSYNSAFYSCYTEYEPEEVDYGYDMEEESEEEKEWRYKAMNACDRDWNTGTEMYDDLEYEY